jgi:uncharacterized protein YbjT (DUF2867 family)
VNGTILVTGATGKQGGATIEALLSAPNSSNLTIFESVSVTRFVEKAPERIKSFKVI